MNSRRKWRVAILGLGHWYSAYGLARALREYPKAALVAAAWDHQAQLDAFTGTFRAPGYRDYGELLEREAIDIVHLAAPVSRLEELTIRSARAGKHIIQVEAKTANLVHKDIAVEDWGMATSWFLHPRVRR